MIRSFALCACLTIGLVVPSLAPADTAEDLVTQPKQDFLDQYAQTYLGTLDLSVRLLDRLEEGMGAYVDADTPISDAERANFECMYDTMSDAGTLAQLAQSMLVLPKLEAMVEADPDFDYADLALNEELMEGTTSPGQGLIDAMVACDAMAMTAARFDFQPELWMALEAAGRERGYVTND